ncbi:amidohydrolase family protein [Pseudonocardia sp. RS010]|uniref:amidohydrolase family protein n=1 Tax=Pseudonocardia sp. RS010 TaxID=3385979 RepID=UPI0039A1B009
MSVSTPSPSLDEQAVSQWPGATVDVDVHVGLGTVERLYPYLGRGWAAYIEATAFRAPPVGMVYPPKVETTVAARWRPEDGSVPAGTLARLDADLLTPRSTDIAVLHPYWGLDSVRHPEVTAVLARAINDLLVEEFLDQDPRLRGTITVPHHDPGAAIAEIERVGGHPGFVQVALPVWSQMLWGKRIWHPLFRAIAEHDLVAAVHYGGMPDATPTATGWPAYHVEFLAAAPQMFQAQLVNIIAEGLFAAVPTLRMTFLESGFTWLPGMMWRMNKEWKGLRRDIPWVTRPPAEIIREHIKVSVQPTDGTPAAEMARIVGWLGSDEMLLYASDYPHGHGDGGTAELLGVLSPEARTKLMADNARAHYRL